MRTRIVLALLMLPASLVAALGDDRQTERNGSGLDAFKQLAGEWVGKVVKGPHEGEEVRINYKVTSAGSAVVETMFPGADHEMVTVIHPDGDDLILTHYCAAGNQPKMRAPAKLDGNKVAFKFTGATNLKSDKDMHMHDATFTFVDKDTLRSAWTHYVDGKPAGDIEGSLRTPACGSVRRERNFEKAVDFAVWRSSRR